jgi:hypothetical protein
MPCRQHQNRRGGRGGDLAKRRLEPELGEPFPERGEKLLAVVAVLESDDGVVGIADDADIALAVPPPPAVSPEVEGVVEVDVREPLGDFTS